MIYSSNILIYILGSNFRVIIFSFVVVDVNLNVWDTILKNHLKKDLAERSGAKVLTSVDAHWSSFVRRLLQRS